jgi:hypothetical protein
MRPLADNRFCVWFNVYMRTFPTLAQAVAFAKRKSSLAIIGEWDSEMADPWWSERYDANGDPL